MKPRNPRQKEITQGENDTGVFPFKNNHHAKVEFVVITTNPFSILDEQNDLERSNAKQINSRANSANNMGKTAERIGIQILSKIAKSDRIRVMPRQGIQKN